MHRSILLLFTVASMVAASPALAGDTRAQDERAARKACLAGDYAKGIAILSDLFVDTRDPTYIYNQGRCLEQNGRFGDAIFRFQEYLRVNPALADTDKAETRKHIQDCQEQLAAQGAPPGRAAGASSEPRPGPTSGIQPPTTATVTQTNPSATAVPPRASSGAGLRTAGIVTAGAGGAALLAGILLNWKANSVASSYKDRGGYTDGKESDRKTYEALGWVGYGVGAACIATGAVLYFFGRSARAGDSAPLVVQPTLGRGEAGAMLKGSF